MAIALQVEGENEKFSRNNRASTQRIKNLTIQAPNVELQQRIIDEIYEINEKIQKEKLKMDALSDGIKNKFIAMFGDPVLNTHHNKIVPFKYFISNIRHGTSQSPEFSLAGEFKFIRVTNIKNGRIIEKEMLRISTSEAAKIEKCKLHGNEIIIVRSGANTGDTCVVTEEYKDQYAGYDIIISLDLTKGNPVFFNELMNTHYMYEVIKPLTVRAAQPHINSEQVQNLPMIVVSLTEQEEFADFVNKSDRLHDLALNRYKKLSEQKEILINKYFR